MNAGTVDSSTDSRGRVAERTRWRLVASTLRATAWCACVLLASAPASAQGTSAIAGVVRDTSDALLPGVTVDTSCCRCWKLDLESIEHVWQRLVGDSVWREQGLPTSHDGKRPFRQQSGCAGISTFTAVDD